MFWSTVKLAILLFWSKPLWTFPNDTQFMMQCGPAKVIQNDGPDAIKVDRIKLIYSLPDGTRIEATPAQDVRFLNGTRAPNRLPGTPPIPIKKAPKNPLAEWEIEGRAFAAKMVPPGQSASGFVYFQVPQSSTAASVYISGLEDPVSGKELYFFEIPMSGR